MAGPSFDLCVIGGGIHGAAVARDAAGRGLKVMLAEKGDYACATSSCSSKLIHGGLRYLEHGRMGLVRESLVERALLLKAAPHLVAPLRFLLPIFVWQKRQALTLRAGLALYDALSFGSGLPASGRLDDDDISQLPRLRQDELTAVLHYCDCIADDARLTLAVLLDARARGADILNRRAVTAITPLADGYAIELDERGRKRKIEARFVVNAAGPWVANIDAMTEAAPPARPLRLVRGSHIVLRMPDPPQADAYTLQDREERVIFVIPWLDGRFLLVGTTDVPHQGDPGAARCSNEERAYLLDAYNRYFMHPGGPATPDQVVFAWSGVRALEGDQETKPSRVSRSPALSSTANGSGGFVTLYGGKLTTHRALAGEVLDELRQLGLKTGGAWTRDVALYGGSLSRQELLARATDGPESVPTGTRRRWALTYGDRIEALFGRIASEPTLAVEIAPGVTRAELGYAAEIEDAVTAEDFLLRRTKLHLLLDQAGRDAVGEWFVART
ncbi:MAG TPA: glycerol-3-phosphate dehydrogenase [Methyloceanibacter sp.]|nr:glycerol-3-phosphate dehydrogenase [Methyloceanibacter sp.]